MKKHFLKSFALLAMLFSALTMSAATKYCGDQVQSTVDNKSVSIGVTILKVGDVLRVSFESEHISGIRGGGTFQQWGNGVWANQDDAVANFKDGWTQNGTIWTKDFAFSTYPTLGTGQIYCLFDIVNAGAPPVAGFTLTDIDLFATCDETPGEGGEDPVDPTPDPETPEVDGKIDWSTIDWLGDGAGEGAYSNKYKVYSKDGLTGINIQSKNDIAGIYVTAPAAITDCSVASTIEGAGIWLHLTAFTAQETKVTINHATGSGTISVYYADGTEGGSEGGSETPGEGGEEPEPEPETPSVVYCDFPTGHEGNATFGDANGRILVSVVKQSETAVRLVVKSADAATKNLDLLYVEATGANPHATTVGSDVAESDLREMSVDITYPTAPAKYSFMIQWSHPDWDGRWQTNLNDITVEQLCTEGGETPGEGGETGDLIVTEYCYYTNEVLTKNGAAIALTWETAENGDIVITMDNGIGAESCSYRNGGFEGGIEAFVVSTDNFVTTTPASDYFTFEKVFSGNEARLVNIADLEKGAKIMHIGSGHALAWTVNGNNEYCFPDFIYTYGGVCNKLEAPSNVAVTDAGVVTFDEVLDATSYEVRVYQGVTLKYTQEITNGGTINFEAYVAGEYTVKVVAKAIDKDDSLESDGVTWNVAASPLPISNYCEAPADRITENQGSCNPLFSWITDATGNVVITISDSEGDENATMFRNNAMGGDFLLDGSKDNFIAYFDRVKTDDYTYTLTLKDAANKPLPGAVISYSGQIDAKSSIHVDDWSKYVFDAYLYGTTCEETTEPDGPTTNVENTLNSVQIQKTIRNGALYIIYNGVTYDVMGCVVR